MEERLLGLLQEKREGLWGFAFYEHGGAERCAGWRARRGARWRAGWFARWESLRPEADRREQTTQ